MAVEIRNVDLTIVNPKLAALSARKYSNKFTQVPNSKLPEDLFKGLGVIYSALTNSELQLDASTLAVSAKDEYFYRLYTPKLYKVVGSDGNCTLFIQWGNDQIGIEYDEETNTLRPKVQGSDRVAFKFTKSNISGRGEDPALEIKVTRRNGKDTEVFLVNVAVAVANWKDYDPSLFNGAMDSGLSELAELVSEQSTGNGNSGDGDKPVIDRKSILTALFGSAEEQTYDIAFAVDSYRKVKTSYGETFIVNCQKTDLSDLAARMPETANNFGLWAESQIRRVLASEPEISAERQAQVVFPVGRQAIIILPSVESKDSINLDFD